MKLTEAPRVLKSDRNDVEPGRHPHALDANACPFIRPALPEFGRMLLCRHGGPGREKLPVCPADFPPFDLSLRNPREYRKSFPNKTFMTDPPCISTLAPATLELILTKFGELAEFVPCAR
jgi:hypothetical protein